MPNWNQSLDVEAISVGDELPSISIPITLQRLVMEASANYDLSLMHHDKDAALSVGAQDAFANTFFLMGMYERLLREWTGTSMRIKRIGKLRMLSFNEVGDVVTFSGAVSETDGQKITVTMQSAVDERITSSAFAIVTLP